MKDYVEILAALTRKCPTCGSASGVPCFTHVRKIHAPDHPHEWLYITCKNTRPRAPHKARRNKEN